MYSGNKFLFAALYLTNWNSAYGEQAGNLKNDTRHSRLRRVYLLWPLLLVVLVTLKVRRNIIFAVVIAIIVALSILRVSLASSGTPVQILYYSTETRIDSILVGCGASLVFMWRIIPERYFQTNTFRLLTIGAATLAVSIMMFSGYDDPQLYRSYLLIFTISIALVILLLTSQSIAGLTLFSENRVLCWIGRISYGLYLWHYLSFEMAKELLGNSWLGPVFGLATTIAIASLSTIDWKFAS